MSTITPRGSSAYSETPISNNSPQASDLHEYRHRKGDDPRSEQRVARGIRVPRCLRDAPVTPSAKAVLTVLTGRGGSRLRVSTMTLGDIAAALGRPGGDVSSVRDALRQLKTAGFVSISQRGARRCAVYEVLVHAADDGVGQQSRYDVVPYALRDALAAGLVTPTELVTWLHLDQVLGFRGWTTASVEELAVRRGVSVRTMRAHLRSLLAVQVIERTYLPSGTTLLTVGPASQRRPDRAPRTSAVVAADAPKQVSVAVQKPRVKQPRTDRGVTEIPASKWQGSLPLKKTVTHDGSPVSKSSVVAFAKRSHLGERANANGRTRPKARTINSTSPRVNRMEAPVLATSADASRVRGTGRQRPRGAWTAGAMGRQDVREVLAAIPAEWTTGIQARWTPGLAARIARWIDGTPGPGQPGCDLGDLARMPVAVVVEALTHTGDATFLPGSVLASADVAIRQMRTDQHHGLRCTDCGRELTTTGKSSPVVQACLLDRSVGGGRRRCWACAEPTDLPDGLEGAQAVDALRKLPLEQRIELAQARVHLVGRRQGIEDLLSSDPQVAAHFIAEDHAAALVADGLWRVRSALAAARATSDVPAHSAVPDTQTPATGDAAGSATGDASSTESAVATSVATHTRTTVVGDVPAPACGASLQPRALRPQENDHALHHEQTAGRHTPGDWRVDEGAACVGERGHDRLVRRAVRVVGLVPGPGRRARPTRPGTGERHDPRRSPRCRLGRRHRAHLDGPRGTTLRCDHAH